SARCPHYLESFVPVLRRGGRARVRAAWLAVPAGVGFGDGEAEGFEFGDQFAEPAVVVEPGAVVGELVVGQDAGGGLAVFLAGPLVVGAVPPGRVGVAAAARVAAAGHPVGEGAGEREGDAGEAGGEPAVGGGPARWLCGVAGPGPGTRGRAAPVGDRAVRALRAGAVGRGAADAAHEPAFHRPPGGAAPVSRRCAAAPGAGQGPV